MAASHQWRFFRSGSFDQVRLDRSEDWQHLHELDPKLWAVLSCPSQGLAFDARTLQFLDSDNDGRIRLPEVLAAVAWCNRILRDHTVLLSGEGLSVSAINDQSDEGKKIVAAAQHVLTSRKSADTTLIVDWFSDPKTLFPPDQFNGDGYITRHLTQAIQAEQSWQLIADHYGSITDRSGEPGIDERAIKQAQQDVSAQLAWVQRTDAPLPAALHNRGDAAMTAFTAIAEKIDDYFARCQLIQFNAQAQTSLSPSDDDWQRIAATVLDADATAAQSLPLAAPNADRVLRFNVINPAWQTAVNNVRTKVLSPLLGESEQLTLAQWREIKQQLAAYLSWRAAPAVPSLMSIDATTLTTLLSDCEKLLRVVQDDLAHRDQADNLIALEKLVRYQRYLREFLQNFVSLAQFYNRQQKAVFQWGELFLDGKSTELCLRVNDAAKHAALASFSGCYLVYCDCTRRDRSEKLQIVAAMTGGGAGNITVGRNGVFFDRDGQDWDATVTRIVENPTSVSDAFWTPYRRIGKFLSDQAQKFAGDKDKAAHEQAIAGVNQSTQQLEKATTVKLEKPAPFDIAKFAGIFAAIGLAIGAIGTMFAALVSGFLSLSWWQMPLAIAGMLLVISGPAMVMAYFKLRQRNLAPLLDANGWAINNKAKITLAFGRALTHSAQLPQGAERSLHDPYAETNVPWRLWLVVVIVAMLIGALWQYGYLQKWLGL